MGRPWSHLILWLVIFWGFTYAGVSCEDYGRKCPARCFCHPYYHPSDGESNRVECKYGGLQTLPVDFLERDTHQLIISPLPDSPNFLTIGPVLTQPEPFSELRDLSITYSNVPTIGKHSFWGLHKLRTLDLTGNNLTSIDMENFRGLVNLTILVLDHNNINQMASETFRLMESLTRLYLSHNNITVLVPRLFRSLGKLRKLDLSYNPLGDLNPEVFADIQNLIIFKCRQCNLKRINGHIYHLAPLIEELDLGENEFKFVMKDDFVNLKKLRYLQYDGNQVSVIVNNVFKENRELESLELANNKIALLAPESLHNLVKLNTLDISNNKMSKLSVQTFTFVRNSLTSMNFSGNNFQIKEIAALLQQLPKLDEVGLANLSIKDIPPNFFVNNMFLSYLDVSSNLLTKFPYEALKQKKRLQYLDISNNKIKSLDNYDLHRLESIATIILAPNPWHCDSCSVEHLMIYMKTSVLKDSLRALQCETPQGLNGTQLSNVTVELLDQCVSKFEAQLSVFAGLILVLVAVLATGAVALCCTRRRSANHHTNQGKNRNRAREQPEEVLMNTQPTSVATNNSHDHSPNCS